MKTQAAAILDDLQRGRKLTPLEAVARHGCMRLAARILELKALGYEIVTETVEVEGGKHVARYSMPARKPEQLQLL